MNKLQHSKDNHISGKRSTLKVDGDGDVDDAVGGEDPAGEAQPQLARLYHQGGQGVGEGAWRLFVVSFSDSKALRAC